MTFRCNDLARSLRQTESSNHGMSRSLFGRNSPLNDAWSGLRAPEGLSKLLWVGAGLFLFCEVTLSWMPWNLSFRYISFHEKKRLQMMLWHHNARVNSHQRWKQTRFRVCFHLWCELTSTMNVTEWQVSWNSWLASTAVFQSGSCVKWQGCQWVAQHCNVYGWMGPGWARVLEADHSLESIWNAMMY